MPVSSPLRQTHPIQVGPTGTSERDETGVMVYKGGGREDRRDAGCGAMPAERRSQAKDYLS